MKKTTLTLLLILSSLSAHAADGSLMKKIIMCESSGHHVNKHGRIICGDDGVSCGIAQFRKETFYEFATASKKEGTWALGKPRWFNKGQQLFLLSWGLNHGYGNRWTCYRKIMASYQRAPMDSDGHR
jgi:hypothetical protein